MRIEHSYAALPERLFAPVSPAIGPAPVLLAWNQPLAEALGLQTLATPAARAAQIFSGGPLPADFRPIALAYAGHQFGAFVPQLGDGRAVLLGEVIDRSGQRYDLQLKGAGRTPYSRGGDGRAWLGPVLREYLVSEAMHALGVPTTRALAAVATGEPVYREGERPGAVLTRVAASHLRVGTFQYAAVRQWQDELRALADYAIERHYPDRASSKHAYLAFFEAVARRQAELVAHWMSVGFVHGVMNTDNTSIAGETIDYGPCAFLDEFRYDKVFSSIDHHGRYAYGNQPAIAQWNLARLAECLLALDDDQAAYEAVLSEFPARYQQAYDAKMADKLGLGAPQADDRDLVEQWLAHLETTQSDYTLSYRALAEAIAAPDPDARQFGAFYPRWRARVLADGRPAAAIRSAMDRVNPRFIARNHQVERAIRAALDGDLQPFDALRTVLAAPFDEHEEHAGLAAPPEPHERVTETFCGT